MVCSELSWRHSFFCMKNLWNSGEEVCELGMKKQVERVLGSWSYSEERPQGWLQAVGDKSWTPGLLGWVHSERQPAGFLWNCGHTSCERFSWMSVPHLPGGINHFAREWMNESFCTKLIGAEFKSSLHFLQETMTRRTCTSMFGKSRNKIL